MKKTVYIAIILAVTLFSVSAQNRCPYGGREDCTGYCGLFIDEDGDGFCDLGTLSQKTITVSIETTPSKTEESSFDKKNTKTSIVEKTIEVSDTNPYYEEAMNTTTVVVADTAATTATAPAFTKPYRLWEISLFLCILYLLSFILHKKKVYTLATHRKIWNILLGVCFIVSCLFGILMTLYLNNPPIPAFYRTLLKYHVDFGIGMSIIGLFHIVWHWRYFLNLFKSKKKTIKH